jgi:hypothetical protein
VIPWTVESHYGRLCVVAIYGNDPVPGVSACQQSDAVAARFNSQGAVRAVASDEGLAAWVVLLTPMDGAFAHAVEAYARWVADKMPPPACAAARLTRGSEDGTARRAPGCADVDPLAD